VGKTVGCREASFVTMVIGDWPDISFAVILAAANRIFVGIFIKKTTATVAVWIYYNIKI